MSRSKIILISLGAAVLVVGAAIAIWMVFLAPPTKQDFVQARQKAEKITTYSGTTLLREFHAKVVAEAQKGAKQEDLARAANEEKKKTVAALESRAKLMNEIGESRVMRDEGVKKKFDTYQAREERYATYIRDYIEAFPLYRSSFDTCIDAFQVARKATSDKTLATLHTAATKDCNQDLSELAQSPITPLARYAKEFKRILAERQKVFESVADDSLSTSEASEKITKLNEDYSRNDPTDDLRKYGNDAVFKGELNALIAALKKKE